MTVRGRDKSGRDFFKAIREARMVELSGGFTVAERVGKCWSRWGARGVAAATSIYLLLGSVAPTHAVSDCVYGGTNFSDGAVACQSGLQYRCSNGTWESLDLSCSEPPPAPTRSKPAECACTANDEFNCSAIDMICCVTLEGDTCTKRCCQRP